MLVDTGGAWTVADQCTVEKLGLPIERVDCRSHWGIAATLVSYYGRVVGPAKIHFSEEIVMFLPVIKVINKEDVLFIIGDNFIAPEQPGR